MSAQLFPYKIYDTQERVGVAIEYDFGADYSQFVGGGSIGSFSIYGPFSLMRVYSFGWTMGVFGFRRVGFLYGCFRWRDMFSLSLSSGNPGVGWLDNDDRKWTFNPLTRHGMDVIAEAVKSSGAPFDWKPRISIWTLL